MFAELRLALIAAAIMTTLGGVSVYVHTIEANAKAGAVAECNEDKLKLANDSLAKENKAEREARARRDAYIMDREAEHAKTSAAYLTLKGQFDALQKQVGDDKRFLDPADPFWMRGDKAGIQNRSGAGRH